MSDSDSFIPSEANHSQLKYQSSLCLQSKADSFMECGVPYTIICAVFAVVIISMPLF